MNALLRLRNDPGFRLSLIAFLIARVALSVWAFIIGAIFPLVVSNFDLHGEPVVTAFDMRTNTRAVFLRVLDGKDLHFRVAYPNLLDGETNTVWDLAGRAVSGERSGAQLSASKYLVEDVFPYRGVAPTQDLLLAPWQRFDANWYLKIAERGYSVEDGSTAYFPLYPFLIRVVGAIFLNRNLLAAVLISDAALIGALSLLYQTANDLTDSEGAKRMLACLLIFPTAFFLFAPYTESLFLLFALASLRAGQGARWGRAGIFGALAAVTRLQGALLLAPLAYLAWREYRADKKNIALYALRFIPLLLIPLVSLAFLAATNWTLVNSLEGQWQARLVPPWQPLVASAAWLASGGASGIDGLNLIATILFGAMLVPIWKKTPREYFWYALALFAWTLFRLTPTQPLVSMTRYVLPIFPVFVLMGVWSKNSWVQRAIIYLSLPLQLYLSAQFFLWGWVA